MPGPTCTPSGSCFTRRCAVARRSWRTARPRPRWPASIKIRCGHETYEPAFRNPSKTSRSAPSPAIPTNAFPPQPRFVPRVAVCGTRRPRAAGEADGHERHRRDRRGVPARPAPRHDTHGRASPAFVRTERGWLVPTVVIILVAAALIVAGVLVSGSRKGNTSTSGSSDTGGAVTIADAEAFDPAPGNGEENNGEVAKTVDGDPSTIWQTEGYNSRSFGRLKSGVGIAVTLDQSATLDTLTVESPTNDWSAEVFVSDTAHPDLASWGDPIASKDHISGTTTFDLGGHTGAAILLWITDLGDGTGDPSGRCPRPDRRAPRSRQVGFGHQRTGRRRPRRRRSGRRSGGTRRTAAPPLRPPVPAVPAPGWQRRRRARRHPGSADRARAGVAALRPALRRSRPGRTASRPTLVSTSCAGEGDGPFPSTSSLCPAEGGDDLASGVADRLIIDDALAALPLEFRAAVVLRDVCVLDYAEIAEVLGVPPGTVRSRIARGRAAVAAHLAGNPKSPDDRQIPRT